MKKVFVLFLLLACTLAGCGKEEQSSNQQQEEMYPYAEDFSYADTANCSAFTADANGLLYTAMYENRVQHISIYDLNGTCIDKKALNASTGDARLMEVGGDALYLLVPELDCFNVLYEIDMTTWQAKKLYSFYGYEMVSNLVRIGDYVYVFGTLSNPERKEYEQYSEDTVFTYNGEVIGKLSVTTEIPEMELLPIEFPKDIFSTANNTLGVYGYTEDRGYVIMEYIPETNEVKEVIQKDGANYNLFEQCEEGYLFEQNERLIYGAMDGSTAEAEVLNEDIRTTRIIYNGGFVFLKNYQEDMKRIYVKGVLKDNKTIQFLSSAWISEFDMPYGCGYQMEQMVLDAESFALKVLAQDRDFDVYLLSSREGTSYNLKKNGAFYPLNEVEGVQEYLDACFPYVKEAAMNEDGEVWMIPVALAIPGLVYNKEYCAEQGVDFVQMDLAEFIDFTEQVKSEYSNQTSISHMALREQIFGQYLQRYDTFDTQLLRDYAEQFKKGKEWIFEYFGFELVPELKNRTVSDFYYDYIIYQFNLHDYRKALGDWDALGMAGVPKMEEGMANVGTLTFLMVNPQSENLEDALQYISDFSKYMLKQKDSFMLADETTYTDTPFTKDCYNVYANGAIQFEMDFNIYVEQLYAYANGETELEAMIAEIERRRKVYVGE